MKSLLFWAFIIILILVVIKNFPAIISFLSKNQPQKLSYPYIKKKYLLTEAESVFFRMLQEVIENRYYIFPQIHLNSLLYIPKGTKNWKSYFNRIIQKSVDFVVCEKEYLSPVLVIELNDSSHSLPSRTKRDEFVKTALQGGGLPVLTILNQKFYTQDDILKLQEEIKNLIKIQ